MKKGKTVKLNGYKSFKSHFGTIDSTNLKSIFVNIQSWVTPKIEQESWVRVVSCLRRDIMCLVNEVIDDDIFIKKCIVDLDLRTSGICMGKKSFFNLEITLFTNNPVDFKSLEVKESIKKLIKTIFKQLIIQNKYFEYFPTKTESVDKV